MKILIKNGFYDKIDLLRIGLAFCVCVITSGLPGVAGNFIQVICGFATISFYILSGYFVLDEDRCLDRTILDEIKKIAVLFVFLALFYMILNGVYFSLLGYSPMSVFTILESRRAWFELIVLNNWMYPVGGTIWYIMALLYAYIVLYYLCRWNLMNLDFILVPILLLFTVLTGELANVVGFHFLGYGYIPGNWLTRALPYLFLGRLIAQRRERLFKISDAVLIPGGVLGIAASVGEIVLLNRSGHLIYTGHLMGNAVLAVCVCVFFLKHSRVDRRIRLPFHVRGTQIAKAVYFFQQPLAVFVGISPIGPLVIRFMSVFVFLLIITVIIFRKSYRHRA